MPDETPMVVVQNPTEGTRMVLLGTALNPGGFRAIPAAYWDYYKTLYPDLAMTRDESGKPVSREEAEAEAPAQAEAEDMVQPDQAPETASAADLALTEIKGIGVAKARAFARTETPITTVGELAALNEAGIAYYVAAGVANADDLEEWVQAAREMLE